MMYQLELLLKNHNVDITVVDRTGTPVTYQTAVQHGLTKIFFDFPMPNKIIIELHKQTPDALVEFKGAVLGNIKFNNSMLERLCVYITEHGVRRSTVWDQNGQVEFEFFDQDPILYHLHMGTTI
jgi:hypothetical protein